MSYSGFSMKKVFEITSLLAAAVLITGCANFLKGADTKAEIEKSIDYANSPYISVSIGSEYEETKTIIPAAGEYTKDYKKGDSFNISFTPKDEYKFLEWMCAPEGAVEFEDKTEKSTAAIIKLASGSLKIFPKNALYPDISSFYPPMEQAGFPQDTTIEIKFNKTVDLDYFKDFNHIAITSDEISLVKYFQAPVIVNETTLEIRTLKDKNIIPLDSEITSQDVTVEIDLSELTDNVSGENLGFREKNQTFVYKINPSKDKDAPKIVTPLTAQKALPAVWLEKRSAENIPLESFETYSKKDDLETVFEQHHVGAKIRLYTQFKDEGSGVKEFRIKEKQIMTSTGNAVSDIINKVTVYSVEDMKTNPLFKYDAQSNVFTYSEDYEFKSVDDGVIQLNIEVEDYAGNVAVIAGDSVPLEVIRDTVVIDPEITRTSNVLNSGDEEEVEVLVSGGDDYSDCKYFQFQKIFYKYQSDLSSFENNFYFDKVMYLLYTSNDGNTWTEVSPNNIKSGMICYDGEEINKDEYRYPAALGKVSRNTNENFYLKAVIIDSAGNSFEKISSIQKKTDIIHVEKKSNQLTLVFEDKPLASYIVLVKKDSSDSENSEYYILMKFDSSFPYNSPYHEQTYSFVTLPEAFINNGTTKYSLFLLPIEYKMPPSSSFPCAKVADATATPLGVLGDIVYPGIRKFYFSSDNFNSSKEIDKIQLYGTLGDVFVFDSEHASGVTIPDDAVPSADEIIINELPVVPNSGIHQAVLSYADTFTENPDYTYFIREYSSSDENASCSVVYTTKEIEATYEGSNSLYYEVVASDGKGNEKKSERKEFTFTGDITPPVISYNRSDFSTYTNMTGKSSNYGYIITSKDLNTLWKKAEDDDVSFLLSVESTRNVEDNIEKFSFVPAVLNNDKTCGLKFDSYDQNKFYTKLTDSTGNYKIYQCIFTRNYVSDFYKFSISGNDLTLTVPDGYSMGNSLGYYYYPGSIVFSAENIKNGLSAEQNGNEKTTELTIGLNTALASDDNTFIKLDSRVYVLEYKKNSTYYTKLGYFPYVTYFCPYYEKNKDSVKCNLKNVIKGEMGLSIMCDQVAFAHTLYSTYNYGSDKESKDYAQWETRGYEAGDPVVCESSFSYEIPDVEKGYWYTTIVHFADGTVYQTEPVLK